MATLTLHRPQLTPTGDASPDFTPIATFTDAALAVDHWGALLLTPSREAPLPSLWGLWRGTRGPLATLAWDEIQVPWAWRDELAARRLALFSRWLGGRPALLAPRLLTALKTASALTSDGLAELAVDSGDRERIIAALRERGPLTTPQLRRVTSLAAKSATDRFQAAMELLERQLEIATVGDGSPESGWTVDRIGLVDVEFADVLASDPSTDVARGLRRETCRRLATWQNVDVNVVASALGWTI